MKKSSFLADRNILEIIVSDVDVIRNERIRTGRKGKVSIRANKAKGPESSAGTTQNMFGHHEFPALGKSEVGSCEVLLNISD